MKRAVTPGGVTFPQSDWHGFSTGFSMPAVASSPDRGAKLPDGRRVFRSAGKWAAHVAAGDLQVPHRDSSGAPVADAPPPSRGGISDGNSLPSATGVELVQSSKSAEEKSGSHQRKALRVVDFVTHQPPAALEELFSVATKYDALGPPLSPPTTKTDDPRRIGHRTLFHSWSDAFDTELRRGHHSPASLAELMYCSIVSATNANIRSQPSPQPVGVDALRIAAAAMIVDKLLLASRRKGEHVLTISCSLLNLLKTEMLNGVYVEHVVDVAAPSMLGTPQPETFPAVSHEKSSAASPMKQHAGSRLSPLRPAAEPGRVNGGHQLPSYIDMTLAKLRVMNLEQQVLAMQQKTQADQLRATSSEVLTASRRSGEDSTPRSRRTLYDDDDDYGPAASRPRPEDLVLRTRGAVWDVRSVAQLQGHCKRTNKLIERLVFSAWRNASKDGKRRSLAVQALGMMLATSSKTMAMRVTFRNWQKWARDRHSVSSEMERMVSELQAAISGRDLVISGMQTDLKVLRARCQELEAALEEGSSGSSMTMAASGRFRSAQFGLSRTNTADALLGEKMKATPDDTLFRSRVNGRSVPVFTMQQGDAAGEALVGEDAPLKGVERVDISVFLVEWVNAVIGSTEFSKDVRLTTVEGGLVDGAVYVALMSFLFPQSNFEEMMESRTYTRLQYIVRGLEEQGLEPGTITPAEITNASVANWCVIAWLFHNWYSSIQPILKTYDPSSGGAYGHSKHHAVIGWCVRALHINRMFPQAFSTLDLRVSALVTRIMTRRLRAAYQTEAEGTADKAEFVSVKESALSDIAEHIDVVGEIPCLVHLLNAKYDMLYPIYEYYRDQAVDANSPSRNMDDDTALDGMLLSSFLRLCADSKLSQRTGLGNIHNVIFKHLPSPAKGSSETRSDRLVISKGKFVELLVRLAAVHLMSANGVVGQFRRGELSATLQDIFTANVFPFAMVSERKQFRRQVTEPRIAECFSPPTVQRVISKLYRLYATTLPPGVGGGASSSSGAGESSGLSPRILLMRGAAAGGGGHAEGREEVRPQLSRDNFLQLLTELKVVDKGTAPQSAASLLTRTEAAGIFRGVQRDEEGVDDEGVTMNQSEFQDALVAVAMVKLPFPFQPLHVRLSKYLNEVFIPAAMARTGVKR
jgi:hypothetical protein